MCQVARRVEELATTPVKIGIMGEFSAGKTLLLGSLIGYADALPVQQVPTTGNVTVIDLNIVDDDEPTRIDQYRVEFMDKQTFRDCFEFMLEQCKEKVKIANIDQSLVEKLEQLTASGDNNPEIWQNLESWSLQVWNKSQQPSLRLLIQELLVLIRAYKAWGSLLCEKLPTVILQKKRILSVL